MLTAQDAYNIHRDETFRMTWTLLPHWSVLSWRERDHWQAFADTVNAQDREASTCTSNSTR